MKNYAMHPLPLVLAGLVALLACACMPSRGPTATARVEPAPQNTVAVPAKLTSSRSEPASTLVLGIQ